MFFAALLILSPMARAQEAQLKAAQQDQYQDFIQTWNSIEFTGTDRSDPARALSCRVSSVTAPAQVPPRVQLPGIFAQLQGRLSEAVSDCSRRMAYTPRGMRDLQDQFLGLLERRSRSALCEKDSDCHAVSLDLGWEEAGKPRILVFSDLVDDIFFSCLRRYAPGVMAQMCAVAKGAAVDTPCGRFATTDLPAACRDGLCQPIFTVER